VPQNQRKSNYGRAKSASAQAEAGNVKLVRGPWNDTFLDEVCSFPNAQHDDQIDAFRRRPQ
jgi:predicted phage terminase large subunit-like protein